MNCYKLLKECDALTALLENGAKSIYKDQAPDSTGYPVCVVAETGETPTTFADNWPTQAIRSVSVWVMTRDGNDSVFNKIIINLMLSNGARYVRYDRVRDYSDHFVRYDFIYNTDVDYKE